MTHHQAYWQAFAFGILAGILLTFIAIFIFFIFKLFFGVKQDFKEYNDRP